MKKLCYCFAVLFMVLVLLVRSPVSAHADTWVLPFSNIPDILEMAQTLFSGGKLEFSSIVSGFTGLDDIIEMWQDFKDNLAHAETQKRAKTTLSCLVDLTMQGINSIAPGTDFVIPFTFDDVNAFTMYNPYWFLQNIATSHDSIVISPDANFYQSILDTINKRDSSSINAFWWYDVPTSINSPDLTSYVIPFTSYSWFCKGSDYSINPGFNSSYVFACATTPLSIYITSSGSTYSYSVSCYNIQPANYNRYNGIESPAFAFTFGSNYWSNLDLGMSYSQPFTTSFSGSIGQVLQDISLKFKNVNIYVDGDLWSWSGEIVLPPVTAPDVIQVGDTGLDTYDVYGLEMPDDLGLDIPNFIDWILNKLMEGATTISLEDAIADEVPIVRTVDGDRAISYSDTRPIWKVIERDIDIPADDPDPNITPTPTPDIGDPPILKLPTFNYLPHNSETTVLSELIDATQKTIPEDLMNLIWNCFGLLVVGGLIYILHK